MRVQALLTALVFAVALAPLVFVLLHRRGGWLARLAAVAWVVAIGGLFHVGKTWRPDRWLLYLQSRVALQTTEDGYVSSDTCLGCHPGEHDSWRRSYHSRMTRIATPESVAAPLGRVDYAFEGGLHYALKREGDAYVVATNDPTLPRAPGEGEVIYRPLGLVTGSHHEQFYWMLADDGRGVHFFPLVYSIREGAWAGFSSIVLTHYPGAPGEMSWNRTCLRCHTTHPRPRPRGDRLDTRVGELGIACEACHGPGAEHVEANRNPWRRYAQHLGDEPDPTITQPERLDHERASEVCGVCHGLNLPYTGLASETWHQHGWRFRPGDDLSDSRYLVEYRDPALDEPPLDHLKEGVLGEEYWLQRFWSDGVVRVGGREYTAIRDTGCFQRGELSCLSCHDLHRAADDPRDFETWADDQLLPGHEGRVADESNEACLQCHPAFVGRESEHSHHAEGSPGNSCYNCHMPNDVWGLLKATRSHTIASPDLTADLEVGRPNACNLCHLDRTLAWTADALERWYGTPPPRIEDEDFRRHAEAVVMLLKGDAGQRALIAWAMSWPAAQQASGTDWMAPFLAQLLADPYGAVRSRASTTLRDLPEPPADTIASFIDQASGEIRNYEVRDEWSRRQRAASADSGPRPALLMEGPGRLDERRFLDLLRERDDTPIYLTE